ncbi:MAG: ABC transporter substrate-binding protein [Planctomycetes bacterium]|nr:ABC transporter substrate-binding protein [Planctomycetota bacterium]
MRILPTLLIMLLVVFGGGLALKVMWGTAATPATDGEMPRTLAGKPQGHVYTGAIANGEPSDVNPLTTYHPVASGLVLAYTHDTLLDRDPDTGELRPALCESYQLADDGSSCDFTLRDNVTFADGQPMTMADVLFGWELSQAGHLNLGYIGLAFQRVRDVEALDQRRLRVHFDGRHYAALAQVGERWMVVQRRFFEERVRAMLDEGEAMPPVASARFAELVDRVDLECGPGTGPYQLHNATAGVQNWRRRQDLLLTRHEGCWRRRVRPGSWNLAGMRVLFRDPAGAKNALLRGEVDWYADQQLDQLLASRPELSERYEKLVYDYLKLGVLRIVWNCQVAPTDDPRVRRALGMLIPRREIVDVWAGAARPAAAHARFGSDEYPDLSPMPFDPKAARALLREAGFDPEQGEPLRLTVLTFRAPPALRRTLDLIVDAASRAGVQLEVRELEHAPFLAQKNERKWHGIYGLKVFEPWGGAYTLLHSEGLENHGEGRWHHEEADRLAAAAQRELDPERRNALWRQLHELAHKEQPAALIVHPMASMLFSKDIEDCRPGPLGLKPSRAWVPHEKQRP